MRAIFRICGNESQPDLPPCFWKVVRTTSDKQFFRTFQHCMNHVENPVGKSMEQDKNSNGKFPGAIIMEDLKR